MLLMVGTSPGSLTVTFIPFLPQLHAPSTRPFVLLVDGTDWGCVEPMSRFNDSTFEDLISSQWVCMPIVASYYLLSVYRFFIFFVLHLFCTAFTFNFLFSISETILSSYRDNSSLWSTNDIFVGGNFKHLNHFLSFTLTTSRGANLWGNQRP